MNLRESFKFIFEILITIILISLAIFYGFYYKINDLKETKGAEVTIVRLKKIRNSLEEYYKLTGKYPDLTQEGINNNLKLLDYKLPNGEIVSFSKIYGNNILEPTPGYNEIQESNKVYDVKDFKKGTNNGGWNYNYSELTGEIHPNLYDNFFSQNIIWSEE